MKFTSHGYHYQLNDFGVVEQLNPVPFVYDAAYSAIYDTEDYRRNNDILQAMRLGFTQAAHGRPIKSIIDTGYGNGAFMSFARKCIPHVYGMDVTDVPVPEGCLKIQKLLSVDVVTYWDCLEHIHDIDFLKSLPCETVVISLPYCHLRTRGIDWFNEKYPHRKPNEHVRHFDTESLERTMASYGWGVAAVSNHEDVVRQSKHGLWNILTMAFKR